MPKKKNPLAINLNLLKPQGNPEKIAVRLFRWLLSSGRYIFIFVEALVIIAFIARFKLDSDLQSRKEAIEEQIPYIESLRPYEILIRNIQTKLSFVKETKQNSPDFPAVFKKIAAQVPSSVKISGINIEKNTGNTLIHISGQGLVNSDITAFFKGLKEDPDFKNVNIANVGLEEGMLKFSIDASLKTTAQGGKNL